MNSRVCRRLFAAVVAAIVVAVGVAAGSRAAQGPNMTGAWTAVKDAPPGIAAAPSAVFGARFWIAQTPTGVTVTRPLRDTAVVATHTIGGGDVRTRVPGATCLGDSAVITNVAWDGAALVHRTVGQIPAGATEPVPGGVRHIMRLVAPDTLVVESTMRVANQADPVPVATVYKKTSDAAPVVAAPPVTIAPATLAAVSWIAGAWNGVNGAVTVEERWTPASGGAMLATSRTVRGPSVTAFEFLCIAERHGGLVYTAMPNGRAPATDFWLTAIDATSATFENPTHDFPKRIRYALRPDGGLEATTSGDAGQRATTFSFKKA